VIVILLVNNRAIVTHAGTVYRTSRAIHVQVDEVLVRQMPHHRKHDTVDPRSSHYVKLLLRICGSYSDINTSERHVAVFTSGIQFDSVDVMVGVVFRMYTHRRANGATEPPVPLKVVTKHLCASN